MQVKSSSDFFLAFANESDQAFLDELRLLCASPNALWSLLLDGIHDVHPDSVNRGYLAPILKSRLEFRRGNAEKILALLNQIYEKQSEADSAVLPPKDSFYYSLLSTVFFGSGKFELARFSLLQALRLAQQENRGYGVQGALLHNLAVSSLLVRDFPSAQEWQKKCLFSLTQNPVCWLRYGEICWQRARSDRQAREPREPREPRGRSGLGSVVWRGNPFALMNGVLGADWRPGDDEIGETGETIRETGETPLEKPSGKPLEKPSGKPLEKPSGKQSGKPSGKQSGKQSGKPSSQSAKPSSQLGNAQSAKSSKPSKSSTVSTESSRGEQALLQ